MKGVEGEGGGVWIDGMLKRFTVESLGKENRVGWLNLNVPLVYLCLKGFAGSERVAVYPIRTKKLDADWTPHREPHFPVALIR